MRSIMLQGVFLVLVAGVAFAVGQERPAQPPLRPPVANAQAPEPWDVAPASTRLTMTPEERINTQVYERVNRSVVNITTRSMASDEFFFMTSPREGTGSGSIIDKNGHIITNYHVIEDARQIAVTLFDSSSHEARLIGSDPNSDLAILQISAPAEKLFPVAWGDSTQLQVGLRVFAIGNPFGLERTLTTGIVSSLNRSLRTENNRLIRGIIQTDAAINPGNSGGPLLNNRGELVGITTAIVGRAQQSSGIGLAIPSNTARRLVGDLVRHGRIIRPDCGIFSVAELDQGLLIGRLVPNGPAQKAGLHGPEISVVRRGGFEFRSVDRSKADIITAADGRPVKSLDDLLSYVESKAPGDRVVFSVIRQGQHIDVPVVLEMSRQ